VKYPSVEIAVFWVGDNFLLLYIVCLRIGWMYIRWCWWNQWYHS